MSYKFDLFVSYRHDGPYGEWVEKPFLDLFTTYLRNELGRDPIIFWDRSGIASGDEWPLKLLSALAQSRCLIAIWSPAYFQSEWCRKELALMLARERHCGYRTLEKPGGLIISVAIHDGDRFPDVAKRIQHPDWHLYARVGDGFRKTERFVEFQDKLTNWAPDVASAIAACPKWHATFLDEQWIQAAISTIEPELQLSRVDDFFPGLEKG